MTNSTTLQVTQTFNFLYKKLSVNFPLTFLQTKTISGKDLNVYLLSKISPMKKSVLTTGLIFSVYLEKIKETLTNWIMLIDVSLN